MAEPFSVQAFWRDWFDWDCVCGCPHPKPGNSALPPQVVERDGVTYVLPHYPGIIGGDFPVPDGDP